MHHYTLHRHFNAVYAQYQNSLAELRCAPDSKRLHDYRVVCKQLDAMHYWMLTFCTVCDADIIGKWYDVLKPFYREGGKARNCYMILKTGHQLQLWDDFPELHLHLTLRHDVRMLDLAKHVRQFQPPAPRQVVKLLKRNESHVDTHGWDMMLNGFVGRRLHEAFTHLHQPVSKGWHTARMLIKACYFLMKDVNEISPLLFNAQLVALYSVLEQKLGDWHDLDMLYHYLVKHQCAVSAIDNKYQPAMTKVVEAIQYQARLLEEQSETGQ